MDRLRRNAIRITPHPAVAVRLHDVTRSPRVDFGQLHDVLASDPTLAAMVVGRGAGSGSTTLGAAIAHLGPELLIDLSRAVDARRATMSPGPLSPLRRDAWRCALLSARLAEELATARGLSPDEAYLAGLVHDLGTAVVIAALEDLAREQPLPSMPQTAWTALVDKLHLEAGVITAVRWGLPAPLIEVIANHHEPVTRLAHLIWLVDQAIALLDSSPTAGVASLIALRELTADDRLRIAATVPQVVAQMATFAPTTTQHIRLVLPEPPREPSWPIDLQVTLRHQTYTASALSPSTISFTAPTALALNWLTELVIHCQPAPITLLANIRRCDPVGGGVLITAEPYALAGVEKQAWFALVATIRRSGEVSVVRTHDDLPRLAL